MRKWTGWICAAPVLGLLASVPAEAAGSRPTTPTAPSPSAAAEQKTPEEVGKDAYNLGLKARDKAWALEDKAKEAKSETEKAKLMGKAAKQYKKAIPLFKTATERIPTFHQAFSSLGYALRKTGEHEQALAAYDKSLKLAPNYGEAIEYRAEAYLGLNRIDEAKEAYMQLFSAHRELADQLMDAMHEWLGQRQAESDGVSSETIEAFGTWIKERGEIADQTAQLDGAAAKIWRS